MSWRRPRHASQSADSDAATSRLMVAAQANLEYPSRLEVRRRVAERVPTGLRHATPSPGLRTLCGLRVSDSALDVFSLSFDAVPVRKRCPQCESAVSRRVHEDPDA